MRLVLNGNVRHAINGNVRHAVEPKVRHHDGFFRRRGRSFSSVDMQIGKTNVVAGTQIGKLAVGGTAKHKQEPVPDKLVHKPEHKQVRAPGKRGHKPVEVAVARLALARGPFVAELEQVLHSRPGQEPVEDSKWSQVPDKLVHRWVLVPDRPVHRSAPVRRSEPVRGKLEHRSAQVPGMRVRRPLFAPVGRKKRKLIFAASGRNAWAGSHGCSGCVAAKADRLAFVRRKFWLLRTGQV